MYVINLLQTNYNLEDLDEESLAYVNRLFSERYKQWKSDLHHYFEAFDDPQVALQEGCPKELEGREDSWAWLCAHFQAPAFVVICNMNFKFIIFFLIFILYDLIVEVRSLYLKEVQASCIKMVFTCRYSRTVHNLHIHCRT